jgi:hypothetical protein
LTLRNSFLTDVVQTVHQQESNNIWVTFDATNSINKVGKNVLEDLLTSTFTHASLCTHQNATTVEAEVQHSRRN